MLITGKVKEIQKPDPAKTIYVVVLDKTRRGKKIEIAITVWGRLAERVDEIKIGERWDFQVYVYSKPNLYQGKTWWNCWIVADRMRKYVPGAARSVTVADPETGEVKVTRKGEIPL